jgi:hypothetical protein
LSQANETADSGEAMGRQLSGRIHGVNRSLGDDIAVPWHYTTFVDFIDHWQTLLAGLIALVAAIITVVVTLKVERRKVDRELDALRKSLAIELRQLIPGALGVHGSSQNWAARQIIQSPPGWWKACRECPSRSSIRLTRTRSGCSTKTRWMWS